jgi:hypothetical protein
LASNNIISKYIDIIILFTDSVDQHDIIAEVLSLNVPIVSVCNTDLNINNVNYLIPGNSNSIHSISIYLKLIRQVIEKGELFLKTVKQKKYNAESTRRFLLKLKKQMKNKRVFLKRRREKRRIKGLYNKPIYPTVGLFCIKAAETGYLTSKQIESVRRLISRKTKRLSRV